MAKIDNLLNALKDEFDRINDERALADRSDELSDVFMDAIYKTMKAIKMGADSDDFSELTVINFVIMADSRGFSNREIASFVKTLKRED